MINRVILLCTLLLLAGCGKPVKQNSLGAVPDRIISMAPNITEIIYALGLGEKLVGATTHCTYPMAARKVPRIGGFEQFNYEAIILLNPDLVILHKEYDTDKSRLHDLGIPYIETCSYFIADILETIHSIGSACGTEQQAVELIEQLHSRIVKLHYDHPDPPRVLIAFGGTAGDDIGQIHAFGTECIHNELLEIAGAKNVLTGKLPYSILSREAILRLNPDIILVLAPELETIARERAKWATFDAVTAVKNNRVHILTNDYTCIPGPRFIQTLEDFSHIIGKK